MSPCRPTGCEATMPAQRRSIRLWSDSYTTRRAGRAPGARRVPGARSPDMGYLGVCFKNKTPPSRRGVILERNDDEFGLIVLLLVIHPDREVPGICCYVAGSLHFTRHRSPLFDLLMGEHILLTLVTMKFCPYASKLPEQRIYATADSDHSRYADTNTRYSPLRTSHIAEFYSVDERTNLISH